jgi:hypothetical protein
MKNLILISIISLSFILGGCSENSTTLSSPDNQVTLPKVPVPIKLLVDGTTILNPANNWGVTFDATFMGSHLGNGPAVGTANLVFTSPTGGNVVNGVFVLTAANGDQLNMFGSGTFAINGSVTDYDLNNFIFEGGTGRFANATGSIQGIGVGTPIDPANPFIKTLHIEGHGNIQY